MGRRKRVGLERVTRLLSREGMWFADESMPSGVEVEEGASVCCA